MLSEALLQAQTTRFQQAFPMASSPSNLPDDLLVEAADELLVRQGLTLVAVDKTHPIVL
jgi:hypothetical protein